MTRTPEASHNTIETLFDRARSYVDRGEYALAAEQLVDALANTTDKEFHEEYLRARLLLCLCYLALGRMSDAERELSSIESTVLNSPICRAAHSALIGWHKSLSGRFDVAIEMLGNSVESLRKLGTEEWLSEASRWRGYAYRAIGDSRNATECMYEALSAAKRRSDLSNSVLAKKGLARIYRGHGRFEEALHLFVEALEGFQELGSSSMFIRTAVDISIVTRLLGNLSQAAGFAKRALAVAEENQEVVPILLAQIALSRAEILIGNHALGRDLVSSTLQIAKEKNLFHPLVLALEDNGDLQTIQRGHSEALSNYGQAFDLLQSPVGDYAGELAWRIGLTHLHLADLEQASTWITRGLDICEKTGDMKELAVTIRAHGILLLHQGDIEGGLQRIREALDRLRRLAVPFEVARCHLELAKAAHQFTKSPKDFELEIETARDIFTQIGAGLGLRWIEELRQSVVWDNAAAIPLSENLISETHLELKPSSFETTAKIRFAQSTLGIEWQSPKYLEALDLLRHFARSKSPLLLTGETGAGKTAFAEIAHVLGSNAREPFVVVNCASLPETLLESELFGHVRGAFTGAERDKQGLIRSAGAGTIFLDEVDKASPSFQANLLHVLDRREIRAVGSHTFHEVRARFVLATNRDLSILAAQGDFLADLEFRISGLRVNVPPLRERIEDFDLLLALALRELRLAENLSKCITIEGRNFLSSYQWPGNLRELFSVIVAAGLLTDASSPISMQVIHRIFRDSQRATHVQRTNRTGTLVSRMDELEKEELLMTLRLEGGSQSRAAAKLGITRRGLNKKLHRLGLIQQLDREGLAGSSRKKNLSEDPSAGDELDS